jgi:NADH dehydrogenase [ubiquinone] 1 alpha subcomplex assembly factor 5
MATGNAAAASQREGGAHVLGTGGGVAVALRGRAAMPDQPIRCDLGATRFMDRMSEHRRLVVAPGEKPRPMQRHGNEQIGAGEQLRPDALHPSSISRRAVRAVAMLEGQHQPAARLVVAEYGTGPVIMRPLTQAGAAQRPRPGIEGKGQAAARALRRAEKRHGAPAARAQLAIAADRRPASEAARRQQKIEQADRRAAQPARWQSQRNHDAMTARRMPPVNPGAQTQRDESRNAGAARFAEILLCGHIGGMTPDRQNPLAVFDRRALRQRRDRAAGRVGFDFLFAEAAERLVDRLDDVSRRFALALDLGCRDGVLARRIADHDKIGHLVQADLSPEFAARASGTRLAADPEFLPFAPGSFDLVVSALALHWVNDLPGALLQLRRALKPDGLLLVSLLGGETLIELRQAFMAAELAEEGGASPRVSPFAELRDLGGLLQRAGFAMPVADNDLLTATYPDALALMRDLRGMGESNVVAERRRSFTRRGTLARAAALYEAQFAQPDGRIPASFEIITLTAWAPHQDQPKPLRPGSARARLAAALDTSEQPAGDKVRPSE